MSVLPGTSHDMTIRGKAGTAMTISKGKIFKSNNIVDTEVREIVEKARVARLATVDVDMRPLLVPVVFVSYHGRYYIPIDKKTKKVKSEKLKRVKNIKANPNVALLIDNYEENWKRLLYLMVRGTAFVLNDRQDKELLSRIHKLLCKKYPQYSYTGIGKTCIVVCPQRVIFWKNS